MKVVLLIINVDYWRLTILIDKTVLIVVIGGGAGGLETKRINQIVVTPQLVGVTDEKIYALGNCAHCLMVDGSKLPARAACSSNGLSCV